MGNYTASDLHSSRPISTHPTPSHRSLYSSAPHSITEHQHSVIRSVWQITPMYSRSVLMKWLVIHLPSCSDQLVLLSSPRRQLQMSLATDPPSAVAHHWPSWHWPAQYHTIQSYTQPHLHRGLEEAAAYLSRGTYFIILSNHCQYPTLFSCWKESIHKY